MHTILPIICILHITEHAQIYRHPAKRPQNVGIRLHEKSALQLHEESALIVELLQALDPA
jgi:hypothetical protein